MFLITVQVLLLLLPEKNAIKSKQTLSLNKEKLKAGLPPKFSTNLTSRKDKPRPAPNKKLPIEPQYLLRKIQCNQADAQHGNMSSKSDLVWEQTVLQVSF